MLYLAVALAGLALLLVLLRERDTRQLERILADVAQERRSLLDEHRTQIQGLLNGHAEESKQAWEALERALAAAAEERQTLLNRIQHPERPIVPIVERESIEPPKDSAELAYVGGIVPEGVIVGTEPDGGD
ncbi:MAG TPA: hypothetical protein VK730_13605 [Solirubrobacteraceae bacterium]|jgi:hypothetical protein|nr:hypothetical protein [Solirubrobacteraceae bacterium]